MPIYQRGDVRIRYEEAGSGFPLLVTPGGGLNSRVINWPTAVFNAMEVFKNDFRCITMDQRNANNGKSTGPVPVDDPWDAFADDQLGLMDHLGIREFFYMGYCIGGCFAGKLMQRAPDRVVAAVFCQTVGHRPENPTVMYRHSKDNWAPDFMKRRPDVSANTMKNTFTTYTRCNRISFTASRVSLSGTARRRCWCCRMTYQGIRCKRRSMSPLWHPMLRSQCSRGRSRKS